MNGGCDRNRGKTEKKENKIANKQPKRWRKGGGGGDRERCNTAGCSQPTNAVQVNRRRKKATIQLACSGNELIEYSSY